MWGEMAVLQYGGCEGLSGYFQRDAGKQEAQLLDRATVTVDAHEVPDSPIAKPVVGN